MATAFWDLLQSFNNEKEEQTAVLDEKGSSVPSRECTSSHLIHCKGRNQRTEIRITDLNLEKWLGDKILKI